MFTPVTLQQLPQNLYQLCQILQQAGQILKQQYEFYQQGDDFDIQQKQDDSPVTQADLLVNQYLTQQLAKLNQKHPILSEEGQQDDRKDWQTFWLLDPLDGTKEFINQTGEFTINLSLIKYGESVISALVVPLKQIIYIGEKGHLPYRWQWSEQNVTLSQYSLMDVKPKVFDKKRILKVAISRRSQSKKNSLYRDFLDYLDHSDFQYQTISAGSAYKFCMMLEGEIDLYPRFHPTSEWDTAAGQGLLQSIGGNIFSLKGQPFYYNQRATVLNNNFVALRDIKDWSLIQGFLLQVAYNH